MSRSLVVCPATEDLELVDIAETPLGPLVQACSRFRPPTAMACGGMCARGSRCDLAHGEAEFEIELEVDGDDTDEIAVQVVPDV